MLGIILAEQSSYRNKYTYVYIYYIIMLSLYIYYIYYIQLNMKTVTLWTIKYINLMRFDENIGNNY